MDSSLQPVTAWTATDVERFLPHPISPVRLSWFYRAGLLAVAAALILLQASYVAMVALAAYATYAYTIRLPAIVEIVHINAVTLVLIAAPAVAGAIVTFFLLKPILARPAPKGEALQLDPAAEPLFTAFVRRLCAVLGAPIPARIDVDLQVNASARLRRGWLSLLSGDLTLTVGLPIVSGLSLRQFAGVLAHELGHFSQRAGMRLYFLIGAIRLWFVRVAHERDSWDIWLDESRASGGWRLRAVMHLAYAAVFCSRMLLRGLLYVANMITAWFSRHMEFDADQDQAALVGDRTFEETFSRLATLDQAAGSVWSTVERTWKTRRLPDDFAALVGLRDANIDPVTRDSIVESMLAETAGRWSTHPCTRDRIAKIAGVQGLVPGADVFPLDLPAHVLFYDFPELCRAATSYHYEHSVGERLREATFVAASQFASETAGAHRRAEALAGIFGPLTQPSRWFRLPESPPEGDTIPIFVSEQDDTAEYWRLLEQALHQHAAVEFMRAGGRVEPAAFHLSSGEFGIAQDEAAASRAALTDEIARLRERYRTRGYLMKQDPFLRSSYSALSAEQESVLELRFRLVAHHLLSGNTKLLSAAHAANSIERSIARLKETCDSVLQRLSEVAYPVLDPGPTAPATVAGELLLGVERATINPVELAAHILDRADTLGEELLGELCTPAAEQPP